MKTLKPLRKSIKTIFLGTLALLILIMGAQSVYSQGSKATDQPSSYGVVLKKGNVIITEFKVVPLKDKGNHLRITIKTSNQLAVAVKNLRLILVKNHLQVKEWKPVGLGPHAKAQVHYDDDMPQPFNTNHYIAILTTDLSSSLPPEETVLDRKETSYRRSGTVEGGM